jgi:hypothetical protein
MNGNPFPFAIAMVEALHNYGSLTKANFRLLLTPFPALVSIARLWESSVGDSEGLFRAWVGLAMWVGLVGWTARASW